MALRGVGGRRSIVGRHTSGEAVCGLSDDSDPMHMLSTFFLANK